MKELLKYHTPIRRIVLLTILMHSIRLLFYGQVEFIVSINPTTIEYSRICSIPGVNSIMGLPNLTTFNEKHNRFIFGGGNGSQDYIYSIDVIKGEVFASPMYPFPRTSLDNLTQLEYDRELDTIFGLHWNERNYMEYFVVVNTTTGTFEIIDSLPDVKFISGLNSTYDQNNHRYIFTGMDSLQNSFLYSIDALTGDILSNPKFPANSDSLDNVIELQYDNSSDRLLGLDWDDTTQMESLVTINIETGELTSINSIPDVTNISIFPRFTVFDELNQYYIFRGSEIPGQEYLYTLDANTGNIISNPLFPLDYSYPDYLTEMQCNNLTGNFYALFWDDHYINLSDPRVSTSDLFTVVPNPMTSSSAHIILGNTYHEIIISLNNIYGQIVKKEKVFNTAQILLKKDNLSAGIYYISITADHQNLGRCKIIIE